MIRHVQGKTKGSLSEMQIFDATDSCLSQEKVFASYSQKKASKKYYRR